MNPTLDWATVSTFGYPFGVPNWISVQVSDGTDTSTAFSTVQVNSETPTPPDAFADNYVVSVNCEVIEAVIA